MAKSKIDVKAALLKAGATGAGAVAASAVNQVSFVSSLSPLIRGGVKILIGSLVPAFMGGKKGGAIIADAGSGFIAVGAIEIANSTVFNNTLSIAGIHPTLGTVRNMRPTLGNLHPTLGKAGGGGYKY